MNTMEHQRHDHLREWAELVGEDLPESVLEEDDDRTDRSRRPI
ncbi:MAG: hypothetical protein ACOCSD_07745 [Halolamina sp.]